MEFHKIKCPECKKKTLELRSFQALKYWRCLGCGILLKYDENQQRNYEHVE